ncbi:VWA domain-containing protein [Nakamurella sp. PAMC28650]|uniref:VWA domain-containing protein n=1 Tax=Nakamurella sp. PAMC28650 TaxID=2762325 RepID=UPI00164DD339|nr:VWA domain-containing protein [Nakamurella sp. PAMC28650]QNK83373.1 VWA domain-containing protein [Nakamurella sp. PAMC28650]
MGRHASADARRRRIAAWPIILAVVVLLLVGLTITYVLIVSPDRKSAACTGNTVLEVTASPGAGRAVSDAASAFDATNPVARSTCVSVSVSTLPGGQAAAALAGGWKNVATPAPALWVVDSAADLAAVDASNPAMTAGHPSTGLAASPVVLAVRAAPSGPLSWGNLANGSVPLVLAVPDPTTNRASRYALQSLVAASATGPVQTVGTAAVAGSAALLQRLAVAAPESPATTNAALAQLSAGTGGFTAVPVVESELAAYNAANQPALTALYPSGATAGDQVMPVPLTATWVTDAMSDAAAAFDSFLSSAKGTAILTADNLRTAGAPAKAPGVDPTIRVVELPDAGVPVRAALEAAWEGARLAAGPVVTTVGAPSSTPIGSSGSGTSGPGSTSAPSTTPAPTATATTTNPPTTTTTTSPARTTPTSTPKTTPTTAAPPGPAVTFVLDASGSMDTVQGNLQRIMWMQAGVNEDILRHPAGLFGLWSFSTAGGPTGYTKLVPVGALGEQVNGTVRSTALSAAVNALTPGGNSWTYGAIQAAYADAVGSAVAGRPNRVIVLTDGLDTTPNLTRATLLGSIGALAAQNKNVVLDVVGLSTDVNAAAMTEIAQAGGGTFTSVTDLSTLQANLLRLTS